ncbi:AMIN domain-containing protein [Nodosilinea sp. E11]|uniref:AMIN domain-containing protein n=1 Tax=Nodosilinea sp. E11 TaxID=3037479 RepID=UPI00293457AB|nr:AMIN domain-containing protein [Nodosilinea sp. E11]WOD40941.1 AMIN domain-containing protein [Nodosilinea sp. E11]
MDYSTHHTAQAVGTTLGNRLGGWAGAGLMASTLLVMCPAAQAETLAAWQFDPVTQQLTLTLPNGVTPHYTVEHEPGRIVLTIPQTQLGAVATQQSYDGAVSQVRLSQENGATVVVLDLAANAVLANDGASLVALAPADQSSPIAAGDQTRWVLTALVAPGLPSLSVPSGAQPSGAQMIVELPVIPGNDPRLGFPAAGTGRLSTSAANLMLPSDIANLTNLPETLPVDPFNLGRSGEQVTVPSLAELDAAVGPVAIAPQGTAPTVEPPAGANGSQLGDIAPLPPVLPPASTGSVLTLEPPPLATPAVAAQPSAAPVTPAAPAASSSEPEAVATIDRETSGVPIAVTPAEATGDGDRNEAAPIAIAPPELPTLEPSAPDQPAIAAEPPSLATPQTSDPAPVIAVDPPILTAPETAIAAQANAINQEPPPVATVPVELTGSDPNLLVVPTIPNTTAQGTVMPPDTSVSVAAAGETILFGTPLPSDRQAAFPNAVSPAPAERPLSPDTLVAAGTVLDLRYVGSEPLDLNTSSSQNQVLLLAQDIRDPITNGIVAPAGSQLIGQFESTPHGQQWVSKMLIAPAGQQVAFSTTSDYLIGRPDVSPPRLAAGAGLGALALLLVTGFSGIGLVGGALVGATTMVGTAPQTLVIEPNQIIQVQVIQDIPRAIPIAAAPEYSREWGTGW